MRRKRFFLGMMLLALAIPAGATPPPQLVILGAGANAQTGLLTVVGVNLGGSAVVVQVSGQTLAVQSSSDTQVVASLPSLPAGTYLLKVSRGPGTVEQDTFSLSIGSGGSGGDIDSITVGAGLTGGGTSGDVSVEVDPAYFNGLYLRTDGSNNGPFARLDIDNLFQGNQSIQGFVEMQSGFRANAPSGLEFDMPNVSAFGVSNTATTGCNRAITGNVWSSCAAAIVGNALGPEGGTGGAFESRGDGGNGMHATNTHPTGVGAGVVGDVLSPNAIAGRFRNQGGGLILQGEGNTWPPVFTVAGDGTVTGVNFVSSSSLRYKTNVTELGGALQAIERLRPVTFDWRASGKHDVGLIAEEVAAVVPDAVAFDGEGAQGIDYQSLTALLIGAMKEQQKQIRELQRELRERD